MPPPESLVKLPAQDSKEELAVARWRSGATADMNERVDSPEMAGPNHSNDNDEEEPYTNATTMPLPEPLVKLPAQDSKEEPAVARWRSGGTADTNAPVNPPKMTEQNHLGDEEEEELAGLEELEGPTADKDSNDKTSPGNRSSNSSSSFSDLFDQELEFDASHPVFNDYKHGITEKEKLSMLEDLLRFASRHTRDEMNKKIQAVVTISASRVKNRLNEALTLVSKSRGVARDELKEALDEAREKHGTKKRRWLDSERWGK